MKTNLILAGIAAISLSAATAFNTNPGKKVAPAKATTYKVDAEKSTLTWNAKKVTGEHTGNIKVQSGSLLVDGAKVTGGEFVFDMASMTCTDLTDAGYNGKLMGHLKSEDFFNVAKFPTSTFKITKVTPKGGNTVDVTGNMTIKGITNAVTFPATLKMAGGTVTAEGTATIDRTKYDIKYGSKSFFENIGDKAIYDDFTVAMKLVASK